MINLKSLAQILNKTPLIKSFLKKTYFFLGFLLNFRKGSGIEDANSFGDQRESFFGYYDLCPDNEDDLVLCHLSSISTRLNPSNEIPISIGVFSSNAPTEILYETKSNAYNWQQGSRAQWIDCKRFVFNYFDEKLDDYIACIHDIKKKSLLKKINYPVSVSLNEDSFFSIDFSALASVDPDYGYINKAKLTKQELLDQNRDVLSEISYETGEKLRSIKLKDLPTSTSEEDAEQKFTCINHLSLSPDLKFLSFIERSSTKKGMVDRMLLLDISRWKVVDITNGCRICHYCWIDEENLFIYMKPNGLNFGYHSLNTQTKIIDPVEFLKDLPDGHPSHKNGLIITDTYPNFSGFQRLLLINSKEKSVRTLLQAQHNPIFNGRSRCDLHPRFSFSNKKVFLDSIDSGKRRLYSLNLK